MGSYKDDIEAYRNGHITQRKLIERYKSTHNSYLSAKQRAEDPEDKHRMSEEFLADFANFLDALGPRPSPNHTLDCHDPETPNYKAKCCSWADDREQANNRTTNRILYDPSTKKSQTVAKWAEESGTKANTIAKRLSRGWSNNEAIWGKTKRTQATHQTIEYEKSHEELDTIEERWWPLNDCWPGPLLFQEKLEAEFWASPRKRMLQHRSDEATKRRRTYYQASTTQDTDDAIPDCTNSREEFLARRLREAIDKITRDKEQLYNKAKLSDQAFRQVLSPLYLSDPTEFHRKWPGYENAVKTWLDLERSHQRAQRYWGKAAAAFGPEGYLAEDISPFWRERNSANIAPSSIVNLPKIARPNGKDQ